MGQAASFSWDPGFPPPEAPGPVFVEFHVTLAFILQSDGAGVLIFVGPWLSAPQKRLGRFVDFHVPFGFSFQIAKANFLIFMGPWHPTPRSESAWAGSNPCGGECRSSTLDISYINSMACRNLHNGKPQTAEVWREKSLSEVSHMWCWKSY